MWGNWKLVPFVPHPSQDTCLTLGPNLLVGQWQRVAVIGPLEKKSLDFYLFIFCPKRIWKCLRGSAFVWFLSVSQRALYPVGANTYSVNGNYFMPLCDFWIGRSALLENQCLPLCLAPLGWCCEGSLPHTSIFSGSFRRHTLSLLSKLTVWSQHRAFWAVLCSALWSWAGAPCTQEHFAGKCFITIVVTDF